MLAQSLLLENFDALPHASQRSHIARQVLLDAIAQREGQANAIAVCWLHAVKVGDEEAKAKLAMRWNEAWAEIVRFRARLRAALNQAREG